VFELLREPPEVMEEPGARELVRARGLIEFRNSAFVTSIRFRCLRICPFTVQPRQTLAIVGATGVEKTTIANLIPRFYEATQGEIRLDGERVGRYTLTSLRRQISLNSQDVFLFNGTVKESILYGCPGASDEEVIRAATAAGAHELIMALEHGYGTHVGKRGVKLSGGQKQRISIARAVLKDAPILILDEATSAVDTQTEQIIQEAIWRLKRNKTTIIIAHRLSTIREADQIIALRDGWIAEQGSHEDLMGMGGLYSRLCQAQSSAGAL
jgi:ATP-binding cassette subfamily B protein